MLLLTGSFTNGEHFYLRCANIHAARMKMLDCILDDKVDTASLRVVRLEDMKKMTMEIWEVKFDE